MRKAEQRASTKKAMCGKGDARVWLRFRIGVDEDVVEGAAGLLSLGLGFSVGVYQVVHCIGIAIRRRCLKPFHSLHLDSDHS